MESLEVRLLLSSCPWDGMSRMEIIRQLQYAEPPAFHSNPSSDKTILLDFNGHELQGTIWNALYGDHIRLDAPPVRASVIKEIWQRVAEDFAPFDVNVTTEDVGEDAIVRSGPGDDEYGIRVVIGVSGKWAGRHAGGGFAFPTFGWDVDTPVFVFGDVDGKTDAEIVSHEVGHSLGLKHDTTADRGYYRGHGVWGPIMGTANLRSVTQWNQGTFPDAINFEDDVAVLARRLGLRQDDYSNQIVDAAYVVDYAEGVIETREDVDWFFAEVPKGTMLHVQPAAVGANLDILARLYDESGNLVDFDDPDDRLPVTVDVPADGRYFLSVEGTGRLGQYDDYGSLGQYTVIVDS